MQHQMRDKPPSKSRSPKAKSDRKEAEPVGKRGKPEDPTHHDTLAGSGMEQDPTR